MVFTKSVAGQTILQQNNFNQYQAGRHNSKSILSANPETLDPLQQTFWRKRPPF